MKLQLKRILQGDTILTIKDKKEILDSLSKQKLEKNIESNKSMSNELFELYSTIKYADNLARKKNC